MTQGEDGLSAFDAQLAAIRRKTEVELAARADALEAAAQRYRRGDRAALEDVRRTAHKIRGVAAGQRRLQALMEEVEIAAQRGELADVAAAAEEARTIAAKAAREEPTPKDAPSERATRRSSPRVLVVDDDEAILRMMRVSLERMGGFEVATAGTRTEALEALRGEPFDLILLDAMMPETTGLELCAEARAIDSQTNAKIVILSAASAEQLEENAPGPGPDAWWRKPLPPKEAIRRVRALLDAPDD